jgi:hypothetical protein
VQDISAFSYETKHAHVILLGLSYHFSPFENENYYQFIISLQANNLTSLSPYATDLIRFSYETKHAHVILLVFSQTL